MSRQEEKEMLIEVGGKKFKMNWRHEVFRTAAEEWLAKYAPQLDDDAKMALREAMKGVKPLRRHGRTTCVIEGVDEPDVKFETVAECSRLDQYRRSKGRVESMKRAVGQLTDMLGDSMYGNVPPKRTMRAEVYTQYRGRKEQKVAPHQDPADPENSFGEGGRGVSG